MKSPFVRKAVFCGASFTLFGVNPVLAVEDKSNAKIVETVTVTGTRQAYQGEFSDLETPQAELTISAQTLKDAGAFDLTQALDLSASVARQNNFGGLWNSFAVRGFVGDENLPSNYLVNGFNAGRGFGGPRDLSGIESVEVLKGPRAALFGRGEPGGTINLVTKRPTFEQEGNVTLSAGSFNTLRTDADWTSPVSSVVAIRLVGFYEDAESYRDTVESTKYGLSPSITWKITPKSQLTYEIEYSHQEIPMDRGVVAVGLKGEDKKLGVIPESRFLGEPGDGPIETDVLGHQVEYQYDFNGDWHLLTGFNYRDTSLEGYATENDFYFGRQFLHLDGEHLTRFRRYRDYDANYYVARAELSGSFATGSLQHRLIVGVDADRFENDQVVFRARGSSVDTSQPIEDELARLRVTNQVINIFSPVYGAYELPEGTLNTDKVETQESVGVYIQDQISITDQIDIRIGARFDDYKQQLVDRRPNVAQEDGEANYSKSKVSPQLGAVYKLNDAFSLYAVYGENFRPLSGADDGDSLEPNQTESTEVGLKFAVNDGALEGTLAFFDVEQSNIATTDNDGNKASIGEAGSRGIEFDLQGRFTETIDILLSYAHIKVETENSYKDPDFGVELPAGSSLLNIPDNQLALQLVKHAELAGKALSLIGGVLYVGERNGFFSDQDFMLPSYTTARIAANYQLLENLELRGEVNNLFDEEHYTNSYADVWVQPGTPRNARLSVSYRF